jgi:dodecin
MRTRDVTIQTRSARSEPFRAGVLQEHPAKEISIMSSSIARVTEVSARSPKSFEDAVSSGIERANKTLRHITSAWVKEMRCEVKDGKVTAYQVNLLVTFVLEE